MSVIIDICLKYLIPCVPPFKVTQGHWNQHGSISCLQLLLLVTMCPSFTVSEINSEKMQIFPTPREFNAATEGVPFGIL